MFSDASFCRLFRWFLFLTIERSIPIIRQAVAPSSWNLSDLSKFYQFQRYINSSSQSRNNRSHAVVQRHLLVILMFCAYFRRSADDGIYNHPVSCDSLPDIDLSLWKSWRHNQPAWIKIMTSQSEEIMTSSWDSTLRLIHVWCSQQDSS